ncbi:hypothetical protein Tco_0655479 [Tanacetum coccineum]|uniref:Uncharacterized protein n=1 Tax=Tanacetum coccineum TaxID=301880 RepID=A0ABQ4X6Q3_9ASTR
MRVQIRILRERVQRRGLGLEDWGPVPVVDKAMDEPLGLGYGALRCRKLALGEGSMPSTFEIGQSYRSMSEQQRIKETPAPRPWVRATWVDPVDGTVYTYIFIDVPPVCVPVETPPSPEWSSVTTPTATIAVDDEYLEVGTQLELHESILHDHTQCLGAITPALFEGYDRDLRELYTRSRAVRGEIFSQRYRIRSDVMSLYGLEVGWIRRIHVLDMAYWGFLRVGTTLDIFQNIILIPYLEYGILSPLDTAY